MQTLDFLTVLHIYLSQILPTPLVFISGYANTENVFHCLNIYIYIYISDWIYKKLPPNAGTILNYYSLAPTVGDPLGPERSG